LADGTNSEGSGKEIFKVFDRKEMRDYFESGSKIMKTAHVNEQAAVLRFDAIENLTPQAWEILLDELRSQHIPSYYQKGKRAHASIESVTGKTIVTVYLTPQTVTMDDAIAILHHRGFEVHDARNE
jgi:hypothetical protein